MPKRLLLIACLAAAAVGAGLPLALHHGSSSTPSPDLASAAVTHLQGMPTRPEVDAITRALPGQHPARGAVKHLPGPFDDRFVLTGVRLRDHVLTGALTVTTDVSEVIDLQVLAGFYDANGALLGTETFDRHGEDFGDVNERVPFTVTAGAAYAERAVSVAFGVPVLVNE